MASLVPPQSTIKPRDRVQAVSLAMGQQWRSSYQLRCDSKWHVSMLSNSYIMAPLSTLTCLYCMVYFRDKGLHTQAFWIGLFLLNPDEGFAWIDGSPVSTYFLDIN